MRATAFWLVVQPSSSIAGTGSEARNGSVPPSTATPGATVPRSELSEVPSGIVRDSSFSVPAQSNRLLARLVTVSTRLARRPAKVV
jgi:hypothetical protein